jgi:segregation and condensation protein A
MNDALAAPDSAASAPLVPGGDLIVSLDGFDGPIDLLLNLAREQKVDLGKLSILALAEQYLAFIHSARQLRLEVAADYLVMAAWLAYLKSRLLLPDLPQEEPNPAAMAEALKFQLLRLEAMQQASQKMQQLPQLGTDIFLRGQPEAIEIEEKPIYFLPLNDLITALAAPQRRRKPQTYSIPTTRLYSLEESVQRLSRLLGVMPSWNSLQTFLPELLELAEPLEIRSALASTFAASLELVKAGQLELQQAGTFAPIYVRRRETLPDEPLTPSEQP